MIICADHVGFSVRDIEVSVHFWTDVLGGKLIREGNMSGSIIDEVTGARGAIVRMALVELADVRIELLQYKNIVLPEETHPPYIPGYAHLALKVEDLNSLLGKIASYGWLAPGHPQEITSGPLLGTRVIYVQSPDGQTLELMESAKGI
ncbi:VOC family protein [Serratia sp. Nf2]|uniref:VOC family protein n=1 Tax=Serratia sp. Nf2 TaxID=2116540 RepID=UPI000D17956E|nr:VOC family protein [Serratia sp. Nf2]PTA73975.1 glyoxalase/bleomycin resistance/dioxygenase family protein [Serratia sp. Nf2]